MIDGSVLTDCLGKQTGRHEPRSCWRLALRSAAVPRRGLRPQRRAGWLPRPAERDQGARADDSELRDGEGVPTPIHDVHPHLRSVLGLGCECVLPEQVRADEQWGRGLPDLPGVQRRCALPGQVHLHEQL